MSLITTYKISLSYTGKKIFHDVSFQINVGERIGLIGPNGAGKTTLLRLLNGEISPDKGKVRIVKGTRIGYLPQEIQETLSKDLFQSVFESIPRRIKLNNDLQKIEGLLNNAHLKQEQSKLAEKFAEIHHEINILELKFPRHKAEKILLGLGFKTTDFNIPLSSLSGGWKMRAALASLLYQRPDLLLLDEPTNHLDIPSIYWLGQFLQDFKGAMILVSHDREFLNRQIHRTLSFESEGMIFYSGNYDFYLKNREERNKFLEAQAHQQKLKIKEAQKFIDRFHAKATKARQAQSKLKLVKKMEIVRTNRKEKTTHFSFPEVPQSGKLVLSIRGISKGFSENVLYQDINLTVLRGDRIAIIGPNGCGKTTLLKIVAGEVEPDKGEKSLGHGVSMRYFAQHHSEMLNPRQTVIQEVYQATPQQTTGFVRNICGTFLFSGNDVDKIIAVLSGGEKARVLLAKLLVNPGNLMVMDEPTNHLDISSSETLINALAEYNGTLLFVSHNQSFINKVATKIWDIRDKEIIEYPGNLNEYYSHFASIEKQLESKSHQDNSHNKDQGHSKYDRKKMNRKLEKKEQAEKRKLIHDTLEPILIKLDDIEKQIAEFESKQRDQEKKLANPTFFRDKKKSLPLINEYSEVRKKLDDLLHKWEQNQNKLESAKKGLELAQK